MTCCSWDDTDSTGTRRGSTENRDVFRFSPACAGSTSTRRPSRLRWAVHPRVRGEHSRIWRSLFNSSGSSPRPRGTLTPAVSAPIPRRFIPASAGNTPGCARSGPGRSVHPRVRGEHDQVQGCVDPDGGSSPRPRGTHINDIQGMLFGRFIPASAGNTARRVLPETRWAVHPRIRGEHSEPHDIDDVYFGSSPHPRGTRASCRRPRAPGRFIPASAGNTSATAVHQRERPVHPRIRGEHRKQQAIYGMKGGSSPHPRGTRLALQLAHADFRFIPASAGNTESGRSVISARSVHPRIRGEHSPACSRAWSRIGSSPHPRGTLS